MAERTRSGNRELTGLKLWTRAGAAHQPFGHLATKIESSKPFGFGLSYSRQRFIVGGILPGLACVAICQTDQGFPPPGFDSNFCSNRSTFSSIFWRRCSIVMDTCDPGPVGSGLVGGGVGLA